jgi:purine nucleosidase
VILEATEARLGELTLVTLGPLTNVAVALQRDPSLPRRLRRLVIMGGAYGAPGNTTPTTEWNIHCDPEAARIVFGAWAEAVARDPTTRRPLALGLDVTEQARMDPEHVIRIARRAGSTPDESLALAETNDAMTGTRSAASNPIVRFLADALRFYFEFHRTYDGFYGAFIHDPLVVAAALDPGLVTAEPLYVDVETRGEITTGMTVADRRHLTGKPPNLDVASSADVATFLDRLIERVGDLAVRRGEVSARG